METLREWLEEHWAAVGVIASITGAVMLSLILALTYNVVATRQERLRSGETPGAATIGQAGVRPGVTRVAGPI